MPRILSVAAVVALAASVVFGFLGKIDAMAVGAVLTCVTLFIAARRERVTSDNNSNDKESILYTWFKADMRDVKVILQMVAGIGIAYLLVTKLSCRAISLGQ